MTGARWPERGSAFVTLPCTGIVESTNGANDCGGGWVPTSSSSIVMGSCWSRK